MHMTLLNGVSGRPVNRGWRRGEKERLPGVSRSTVSAERRLAGYFAARVLALRLVDSCTSSSAVWMNETVVLHVLRSFATDLILRGRNHRRGA